MGKGKNSGFLDFLSEKHAFSHFEVKYFNNQKKKIIITLKRTGATASCPGCGMRCSPAGYVRRSVRDLDLIKRCYIEFGQAKIRCRCGYRGVERLDFVGERTPCTRRFAEQFVAFTNATTTRNAAKIFGVDGRMADDIETGYFLEAVDGKRLLGMTQRWRDL